MGGICGIVQRGAGAPAEFGRLTAMCSSLLHRNPDDGGAHEASRVLPGSRRLSIADLSVKGHMPLSTLDGRYWIAFDGECYNHRELRPSLEAKGYKFRSNGGAEVVLYMYAEEGADMLHWLNGVFVLAVWDAQEQVLFMARDRLGVKPVYYAIHREALYFASEHKALFAAGITPEFDPGTWEELLCFRYVTGEQTPFRGVHRLLPGHYLRWHDSEVRVHRWWNLGERACMLRATSAMDPAEWLRQTFDDAVDLRRISDVPVGALLSGDLGSSCLAASLGMQGVLDVAGFTVRFDAAYCDESLRARRVADKWGLKHHDLVVDERELLDLVFHYSWMNDVPLAHENDPHLLAVSRYAKPKVSVLLSGEGADEIMGDYVRYHPLRNIATLRTTRSMVGTIADFVPPGLAGTFSDQLHKLQRMRNLGRQDDAVLFNACDVLPGDLAAIGFKAGDGFASRRRVLVEAIDLYPGEPVRQAMYLDQHTFLASILDRNDRTTMKASIECRMPFLDYQIVEGLAALPSSSLLGGYWSKSLLREAFAGRLPPEILKHHRRNGAVPWQRYFAQRDEFRDIIAGLPNERPICDGAFDCTLLKRVVNAYLKGDFRQHSLIRQLFFIAIWHKACVADMRAGSLAAEASPVG